MYTIGFTTKFYTLWDVTVEHFTNSYGRKGERVTANYIKNISMDEQAARAKYPDAPVDLELRGHSSFCWTNWEPLPSDVFPCGIYMGKPIAPISDTCIGPLIPICCAGNPGTLPLPFCWVPGNTANMTI